MPNSLPTDSMPALLGALLLMALGAGLYLFKRLDTFREQDKQEWLREREELKSEIKELRQRKESDHGSHS